MLILAEKKKHNKNTTDSQEKQFSFIFIKICFSLTVFTEMISKSVLKHTALPW